MEMPMPTKNSLLRYLPPAMEAKAMFRARVMKFRMMPRPVARDWEALACTSM